MTFRGAVITPTMDDGSFMIWQNDLRPETASLRLSWGPLSERLGTLFDDGWAFEGHGFAHRLNGRRGRVAIRLCHGERADQYTLFRLAPGLVAAGDDLSDYLRHDQQMVKVASVKHADPFDVLMAKYPRRPPPPALVGNRTMAEVIMDCARMI